MEKRIIICDFCGKQELVDSFEDCIETPILTKQIDILNRNNDNNKKYYSVTFPYFNRNKNLIEYEKRHICLDCIFKISDKYVFYKEHSNEEKEKTNNSTDTLSKEFRESYQKMLKENSIDLGHSINDYYENNDFDIVNKNNKELKENAE